MPRARQSQPPEGLVYRPDFLDPDEERGLLAHLGALELGPVIMHGVAARRTVAHFGYRYGYQSWHLEPGPPLPDFLGGLRQRCAALAGLPADAFEQSLVTRYPAGAGIGWHRDAPGFGPVIVGVSLLGRCRMRFRRPGPQGPEAWELELAPRSAYLLAGPARAAWQHAIPGCREPRYSLTFRMLRRLPGRGGSGLRRAPRAAAAGRTRS
jgi:alkylated DNA repair protein (DNA oxidative demethylase)